MNMKRAGWLVCAAMILAICGGPARAQGMGGSSAATPGTASLTNDILTQWNRAGAVLLGMAKDFPDDKMDFRPSPVVRTFAEQILHATAASEMFANMAAGIKPASFDAVEKPSREKYKTRAQIVDYIQKTFADGAAAIQKYGDQGLLESVDSPFEKGKMVTRAWMFTFATAHVYDHYGQCVVYYRLNGLVPPESRSQQ
jgi:uncharacterized damage-inducible protein DinB